MYDDGDDDREGMVFSEDFLPTDDGLWPFSFWLIQRRQEWKFFRRLLRQVRCLNPDTGAVDVLFSELVHFESPRFPESAESRRAHYVDQEFFEDEQRLERCLCDALAILSSDEYRELVDLQAEDLYDVQIHLDFALKAESWKTSGNWQFPLLGAFDEISRIVGKWEEELRRLRDGDHLAIWRYYASKGGAREGGLKSGKARAQQARITPELAAKAFESLRRQGKPERSIAAIVAQRHAVTPDHVRRVIKGTKKPA